MAQGKRSTNNQQVAQGGGMPLAMRAPSNSQLAQSGYPQEMLEFMQDAAETGWMIAIWKTRKRWKDGDPLPAFDVKLYRRYYPYNLLLKSEKLLHGMIEEIDPFDNNEKRPLKVRIQDLEKELDGLKAKFEGKTASKSNRKRTTKQ